MARGKRAESNGLDAAKALKEAQEQHQEEVQNDPPADEGEADDGSPGAGHNRPPLTDDERFALLSVHKRALVRLREAKKLAAKAVKDAEKLVKSELGDEAVLEIDHMIDLETVEGEAAFKAQVEREVRVARWMGLPVGSNGSLFDAVDRAPAVDRAAAAGKRAGLAGETCQCPHDPSTPQYAAFMTGYGEGQRIMFAIKPLNTEAAADNEFDDMPPADEPPAPEGVALS